MRILILSRGSDNYTTKRLKEEALSRSHEVRVISYSKCYMAMESSRPVVRYEGRTLEGYDAIIPRIAQSYTPYGTAIVRQFEMQGVYTLASSLAITRSRDKLRSLQLLSRAGIGIPKTLVANETSQFSDLIEQVGGAPLIIKVARGTHGNGVVLAETTKAAKAVMQAFHVENVSFVVQEFIKESAGTDIRVLVVGGKVAASIQRQNLDEDFRSNTHQGGIGAPVKLTAEERRIAVKAAKVMGLPVCAVDMMRSGQGPLILEINSSGSLRTPEEVTGRNIAGKIIQYIELNAKRRNKKDRVGA